MCDIFLYTLCVCRHLVTSESTSLPIAGVRISTEDMLLYTEYLGMDVVYSIQYVESDIEYLKTVF